MAAIEMPIDSSCKFIDMKGNRANNQTRMSVRTSISAHAMQCEKSIKPRLLIEASEGVRSVCLSVLSQMSACSTLEIKQRAVWRLRIMTCMIVLYGLSPAAYRSRRRPYEGLVTKGVSRNSDDSNRGDHEPTGGSG